jgi:hypothetical protein
MHELTLTKMLELLQGIIEKERSKRKTNLKRAAKDINRSLNLENDENIFKIKLEDKFMSYNSLNVMFSLDRWKNIHKLEFDDLKHNWKLRLYCDNKYFVFKFRKNCFWEQYADGSEKEENNWILSSKYNIIYDEYGIANNYIDY